MEAYSHNQPERQQSQFHRYPDEGTHRVVETNHSAIQAADELAASLRLENARLKRQLQTHALTGLVGHSPAIRRLQQSVAEAARSEKSVLIQGEAGTGKCHVAQAIHLASSRADAPFIKLNCALLSADAIDREIFGETNQNFHGRSLSRESNLCQAVGGTLFLEEIDSTSLTFQRKFLSILQQQPWHIEQTNELRPLDIRVISATHSDISDRIRRNLFHQEFYNHLTELTIHTPTLNERTEDIQALTTQILNRLAVEEGKPAKRLSADALMLLEQNEWAGNFQELQNVISRACALNNEPEITIDMLSPWLTADSEDESSDNPSMTLKEMERKLIEVTFARCGGNRERTAQSLQIGLRTLSGKLREYGYPPRGGPGSNLKIKPLKAA